MENIKYWIFTSPSVCRKEKSIFICLFLSITITTGYTPCPLAQLNGCILKLCTVARLTGTGLCITVSLHADECGGLLTPSFLVLSAASVMADHVSDIKTGMERSDQNQKWRNSHLYSVTA